MSEGQGTLFTHCRPTLTTKGRSGYVSHCACGWQSASERTKKYALDVLAYHLNQTLTESLKSTASRVDGRV